MALTLPGPYRNYRVRDLRSYGLANGITLCVFPGQGAVNLVTGKYPVYSSGFHVVSSPYGPASQFTTGTSSGGFDYGVIQAVPFNSPTYSFAALAAPSSVASSTLLFCQGDVSGAPFAQASFAINTNENAGDAAGQFAYFEYDGGIVTSVSSNNTKVDGKWHVFGASRNYNLPDVFWDGTLATSTQNGSAQTKAPNLPSVCCGQKGFTRTADYPVAMVVVWNRALTLQEHTSFASNPWQIFRPRKRFFFPGGAVSPDITLALSGSSATSGSGTIKADFAIPTAGESATSSAGDVKAGYSIGLNGIPGTTFAGTIKSSFGIPLTGQSATTATGTVTPFSGLILSLTGQRATSQSGTILSAFSIPLTGNVATASTGTVTASFAVIVALVGERMTTGHGSVLAQFSIPLHGQRATARAGTLFRFSPFTWGHVEISDESPTCDPCN